jgi:L-rhamnose mutarotase
LDDRTGFGAEGTRSLNYSIFLHPDTGQLFAYAEIEDELRWQAIAETGVCKR